MKFDSFLDEKFGLFYRKKDIEEFSSADMPNDLYHSINDYYSSTRIKQILHNPYGLNFTTVSKELDFGSLVHMFILEPEKLEESFAVEPEYQTKEQCGKTIKSQKEKFLADNVLKKIISVDEYRHAEYLSSNVLDLLGKKNITIQSAEKSYFTSKFGINAKCRPDFIDRENKIVYDVKTTKTDIDKFQLSKTIFEYGYHISAAWYLDILEYESFRLVFINKSNGSCSVFEVGEISISEGREEYSKALEIISNSNNRLIETIDIPDWKLQKSEYDLIF